MRHGMKNLRILKVIHYAARLIDINEYLVDFPGENVSDDIGETDPNEILLNSMKKVWSKKAYVQGFYFKIITLKESVNMFDHMEIAETNEGVVKTS